PVAPAGVAHPIAITVAALAGDDRPLDGFRAFADRAPAAAAQRAVSGFAWLLVPRVDRPAPERPRPRPARERLASRGEIARRLERLARTWCARSSAPLSIRGAAGTGPARAAEARG